MVGLRCPATRRRGSAALPEFWVMAGPRCGAAF